MRLSQDDIYALLEAIEQASTRYEELIEDGAENSDSLAATLNHWSELARRINP